MAELQDITLGHLYANNNLVYTSNDTRSNTWVYFITHFINFINVQLSTIHTYVLPQKTEQL